MTFRKVDEEPLTRIEAAERSGLSIRTIDRYLADGTLPFHKLGKAKVRIFPSDIDALLTPAPALATERAS